MTKEYWTVCDTRGILLYIDEDRIKYRINHYDCLDKSWIINHNMTGVEVVSRVNSRNNITINNILENITDQEEIDSMFEE